MNLLSVTEAAGLDPTISSPETSATPTPQSDEDIRKAAVDFETAFIGQMLKFSGFGDALVKGGGEDVAAFTDFYIERFSEKISENGGFGLADKFYDKLKLMAAQGPSAEPANLEVDL